MGHATFEPPVRERFARVGPEYAAYPRDPPVPSVPALQLLRGHRRGRFKTAAHYRPLVVARVVLQLAQEEKKLEREPFEDGLGFWPQ